MNTRDPDRFNSDSSLLELVKIDSGFQHILNFLNLRPVNPDSFAEYTGIARLSPSIISRLLHTCDTLPLPYLFDLSVTDLLSLVHSSVDDFLPIDLAGKYCQLSLDGDLTRYMLGSKADSLSQLTSLGLQKSRVLDMLTYTYHEWFNDRDKCLTSILATFKSSRRSSSLDEDTTTSSAAGVTILSSTSLYLLI